MPMSLFRVGMTADRVLAVARISLNDPVKKPEKAGEDRLGMIVRWFYRDATLTLCRTRIGGPYRVSAVEPSRPADHGEHAG